MLISLYSHIFRLACAACLFLIYIYIYIYNKREEAKIERGEVDQVLLSDQVALFIGPMVREPSLV